VKKNTNSGPNDKAAPKWIMSQVSCAVGQKWLL